MFATGKQAQNKFGAEMSLTSRSLGSDRLVACQRFAAALHVLRHDTELVGGALQEARHGGVGVLGVNPAHGRDPSAAVVEVALLDHIATVTRIVDEITWYTEGKKRKV